ncbi:hypothetical protein AVI51_03695 [Piscirickettsia salmonis]|uniref:Uncharacterized protein n=1 Tax=Piscirickettsia salmonis TaxID=1238 RepID=A0A9Q5YKT5_PISSA|nr:hypothetical protein [Piscirickettsia salmonis]ALA25179.1 addiction module protein [Piscirickettsia salmonis]APS45444.1 hypothetical protein AVI48_14410 [Piscirickettsia salmonis]APS50041.1 hypothetical protein AVI50_03730 [Piscirickettsia salmonis]APS53241.1 hypothetical protein AVI51_03695 [Piscirickettsia salmonis]APS55916.1 hypothetical protein AVI52_00760 [Piscirickettsia salmonis]
MTKEIKRIAYASTYTHQCNMVELLEHHTFESVIFFTRPDNFNGHVLNALFETRDFIVLFDNCMLNATRLPRKPEAFAVMDAVKKHGIGKAYLIDTFVEEVGELEANQAVSRVKEFEDQTVKLKHAEDLLYLLSGLQEPAEALVLEYHEFCLPVDEQQKVNEEVVSD